MGLRDKIKKIFVKESENESIQSDSNRFNSDLKRSNNRFKAIESASNFTNYEQKHDKEYENQGSSTVTKLSHPLELQRESLQLGVAAGYTGKSLREIESSLSRIESQMPSKDWFTTNFEDNSQDILNLLTYVKNLLEKHDSSASNRLESIENALNRLSSTARTSPEPVRQKIVREIETIRSNLPLTSKMKQLVRIVQENGDISYENLASNLGISKSSLRGLLSNTIKRTDKISRHSVNGNGHVKYNQE